MNCYAMQLLSGKRAFLEFNCVLEILERKEHEFNEPGDGSRLTLRQQKLNVSKEVTVTVTVSSPTCIRST